MLFMISLLTTYLVLFLFLHRFIDLKPAKVEYNIVKESVAVVIAMRNEENRIISCLESINLSHGFESKLHVYLVDDHSIDSSYEKVKERIKQFDQIEVTLLEAKDIGKKKALIEVLSMVSESWCFLTDADCVVQPDSIRSLIYRAKVQNKEIAYGPVLYNITSFSSELMAYENLNTQFVGEALLKFGKPAMVNGENTLLSKNMISSYIASQNINYASGDDVFFSQSLGEDGYAASYELDSAVITSSPDSMGTFFNQRLRWASKYSGYSGGFYKLFPVFIFIQNLSFLFLFASWVALGFKFDGLLITLVCKWLIEWAFHSVWFEKYNMRASFLASFLLTVLQPVHISVVGLLSLVDLPYDWKGRNVVKQSLID